MSQTSGQSSSRQSVNVDWIESIDEKMLEQVRYAIENGSEYARFIAHQLNRSLHPLPDLTGLRILEIGCPRNFGCMLVCHALGADVTIVNDYIVPWDPDYHPAFTRAMHRLASEGIPDADWSFITRIIDEQSHPEDILRLVSCSFSGDEPMPLEDRAFDAVVSNAVISRFPGRWITNELARITGPDGPGLHQIDFRDPRDPDQPLEFLTLSEKAWDKECRKSGTRSNRLRPTEFAQLFREAGFRVNTFGANMWADDEVIRDARPRLDQRFGTLADNDLRPISGRFYLSNITDEVVRHEAEYQFNIGRQYGLMIARELGRSCDPIPDLDGLRILELGPGQNFGPMLVCRAFGASRVAVLDKYLAEWDPTYHPRFYRALRELGEERMPSGRWHDLHKVIAHEAHDDALIDADRSDLGGPRSGFEDDAFDVVVSNAVLEHVGDVPTTARELARITAPGGIGLHQVDFRDHQGFDQPLTFLTVPDEEYEGLFRSTKNSNGNRVRPFEMAEMFNESGFDVHRFDADQFADDAHLTSVRPNLATRFARMTDEQLIPVSGRLHMRRSRALHAHSTSSTIDAPAAQTHRFDEALVYAIGNAAGYAYGLARYLGLSDVDVPTTWTDEVYRHVPRLDGLRVLELGPGPHFASSLVLYTLGARVSIIEKYAAPWDDDKHPELYGRLRELGSRMISGGNWDVIDDLIRLRTHAPSDIRVSDADLSGLLTEFDDDAFDAIVSNAVLEHVDHTELPARELARLTRPGGVGIHQIDFRNHRDFDDPLAFLTVPEEEYEAERSQSSNRISHRLRCHEVAGHFEDAGFSIAMLRGNMEATDAQLAAVRPHLDERFREMTDDQLRVLAARVWMIRS